MLLVNVVPGPASLRIVCGIDSLESSATVWSSVRMTITFGRGCGAWRADAERAGPAAAASAPAIAATAIASPARVRLPVCMLACPVRTVDEHAPVAGVSPPSWRAGGLRRQTVAASDERNEKMGENIDEAKGRVKEAAGDLTDDQSLKNEGKVDQATSTVKEKVGDAADKVKDVVNPDDKD